MFIGLDLGTSFIKGAVLDLDQIRISHVERAPFPPPLPARPVLFREFDPAAILVAARSVLARLLSVAGSCEGILLTGQMHGVVFTADNGAPLSPFVNWQDQRILQPHPAGPGTVLDVLRARLSVPDQDVQRLGNELRAGLPIGLLFWLAEAGIPDDWAVTETALCAATPAGLPDFVAANLCGCVPVTDVTDAAAHGLLDCAALAWHTGVIDRLGLGRFRLPAIRPQGAVVGALDWERRRIPVVLPVGDYQAALCGALLADRELSLNISTGSQVSLISPALCFGEYQTRPYFDGAFTRTITHIPAGRALNVLVRLLTELPETAGLPIADPWPIIARLADAAPEPSLRIDLGFFQNSLGSRAGGAIDGIREDNLSVGGLFRAAFAQMAENYRTCAERIAPDRGWDRLVFSGGLPQKIDLLRALISERFGGPPYRFAPHAEDTLFGLLMLGRAFTGRAASVAEATEQVRGSRV